MFKLSMECLASWENLHLAWVKASKGKRKKAEVAQFEHQLEENLLLLSTQLLNGSWKPSGYRSFFIPDPKRRLISAAPFPDRVVHHALCNIIEPPFERSFIKDSYANRAGKGNHKALDAAQQYAQRYPYVLSLDVRKFFPSIDHDILYQRLVTKVNDKAILLLIRDILDSGKGILTEQADSALFVGDDLIDLMRPKGLPIGNLTSQFWANVYLSPLDHFVKRSLDCKAYVRFVDDIRIFATDKAVLWKWKFAIEQYLASLRLRFHEGAHPVPVTEGFGFLGFQMSPDWKRVKRRKGIQYQQKLKQQLIKLQSGSVDEETILQSILSWNNHLSYGNTVGLRKSIFSVLPAAISNEARVRYQKSCERKASR